MTQNNSSIHDAAQLSAICERIIASGTLGRSKVYATLLNYLVECSIDNRMPKEIEIALDVMGRDADFDVSKDSLVRVYVHNLRKKIEAYFAKHGAEEEFIVRIPKGQYTLECIHQNDWQRSSAEPKRIDRWHITLAAIATTLFLFLAAAVLVNSNKASTSELEIQQAIEHPIWQQILDDTKPIMLVLGDYFIFGEVDPDTGNVLRMVREFSINSKQDFEDHLMLYPEQADSVMDLDLTYLPTSTAIALKDVIPLLQEKSRRVSVVTMSEMGTASLKTHHIVYLGYISGLAKLNELVFDASRFAVGDTYDEIIDLQLQQHYFSGAGIPTADKRFHDYGLLSTFPSPDGTQLIIIAGMRDAGLMHIAQALSSPNSLQNLNVNFDNNSPIAFEALFEIFGYDGMNFEAALLTKSPLNYNKIWGGKNIDLSAQN